MNESRVETIGWKKVVLHFFGVEKSLKINTYPPLKSPNKENKSKLLPSKNWHGEDEEKIFSPPF